MAVVLEQVLMALGSCTIDCEPEPELARLLELHRPPAERPLFHALIYWGEDHIATAVILLEKATSRAITIGGPGPEWHLGTDDRGPLIFDREYVAGTNKLSNPSFEPPLGTLYWRFAEGSGWEVSGHDPRGDGLLMEDGFALLLESGDRLLLG